MTATALSCTPHSAEAAFLQAQADEARFVVVRGQLDFDAGKLPKVDYNDQGATPAMTRIKARITGQSLSRAGFSTPFDRQVTLAVACFGPWCAQPSSGGEVLAFIELHSDGDVIATNPCGGYLFGAPTPATLRSVQRCFADRSCKPPR
jgi:hypothetical protein